MTEGDDASHRFLPRIRLELEKLPLTDTQRDDIVPRLLKLATFLYTAGGQNNVENLRIDSALFDFAKKISAVEQRFEADGMATSDYLQAALKQPQLFYQSPATIIANIEDVAGHFRDQGVTLTDYLRAALKQPSLFYQSPATIIANIAGVAGHFRDRSLTLTDYLRAALKQPSLFYQSPATIIANIAGVAGHFRDQGLTLDNYLRAAVRQPQLFYRSPAAIIANIEGVAAHFGDQSLTLTDFLRAAVRQPQLFYQSPATIISNIAGVAGHFRDQGLTLDNYLRAAVRQPQLFYQSPATIIRHVALIINLHHQGWLTFPGEAIAPPAHPLKLMFDYLVKNPLLLCLSDDNYALREAYARLTGNRFNGTSLLTRPRHQLEQEFAAAFGPADPRAPPSPEIPFPLPCFPLPAPRPSPAKPKPSRPVQSPSMSRSFFYSPRCTSRHGIPLEVLPHPVRCHAAFSFSPIQQPAPCGSPGQRTNPATIPKMRHKLCPQRGTQVTGYQRGVPSRLLPAALGFR